MNNKNKQKQDKKNTNKTFQITKPQIKKVKKNTQTNKDKSILQKEHPYNGLCKLFIGKPEHQNACYGVRATTSPFMAIGSIFCRKAVTLMIPFITKLLKSEPSVILHSTNCSEASM